MFDPSRLGAAGLALLVLLILYFFVARKRLADVLNLKTFFEHKTTEILVFLGVGIALRLFLTHIDKQEFHFLADAIVVASTIGLMVEVQHIRESHRRVNVEGEWLYQVQDSNGNITHGGTCTIKQDRVGNLTIEGARKYKQRGGTGDGKETSLYRIMNDGILWDTDFAMIHGGEDTKIDFVYKILLDGRYIKGYCHLTPEGKEQRPSTLRGAHGRGRLGFI